ANVSSSTSPSSTPSFSAIARARSGCERPEKTISRFCGPRSIQCPRTGSLTIAFSRPGSASSVAVRLSMLLVDPPFLRDLSGREPGQRAGGDIIRDDRARRNPHVVAHLHRGIEDSVDAGPDIAAD